MSDGCHFLSDTSLFNRAKMIVSVKRRSHEGLRYAGEQCRKRAVDWPWDGGSACKIDTAGVCVYCQGGKTHFCPR